jgi:type III pantothenate kinase
MNLTIDVGNNQTKIGVFEGDKIIQFQNYAPLTIEDVKELFQTYKIENAIIADVAFYDAGIDAFLRSNTRFIKLSHETKLPVTLQYLTPETLGRDRIATAAAAVDLFPGNNCLVIDAGTSITYDIITAEKEFLGGGISPGISMRFKALHNFTARLPLLKKEPINYLIGKNTEQSILSGVINGTVGEMNFIIDSYHQKYPDLQVLLTGGDAPFFETRLNYKIFAVPNLVLRGLNKILQYNVA